MIGLTGDLATVGLLAGLMGLDRRGAFQVMLSQPIVALPLLALLLGGGPSGLMLGALVQLLWMSSSLFGANVPPNETVAGLTIGGMVLIYEANGGPVGHAGVWSLAVLIGAPVSVVGRWLEERNDAANLRLSKRAEAAARLGRPRVIELQPLKGLLRAFLANALLVTTAAAFGLGLLLSAQPLLDLPATDIALSAIALYVLPAIGLGVALVQVRRRRGVLLAAVVFVVVGLLIGRLP